jgi:hypothetical protein
MDDNIIDVEIERSRRASPETVKLGAGGRQMMEFVAAYQREGGRRSVVGVQLLGLLAPRCGEAH